MRLHSGRARGEGPAAGGGAGLRPRHRNADVPALDARFRGLTDAQRAEICDDICYGPEAAPEFQSASRFFDMVRDLTATAFYTTLEGMEDLGYVGNVPLARWNPPPEAALRHVGLVT